MTDCRVLCDKLYESPLKSNSVLSDWCKCTIALIFVKINCKLCNNYIGRETKRSEREGCVGQKLVMQ